MGITGKYFKKPIGETAGKTPKQHAAEMAIDINI